MHTSALGRILVPGRSLRHPIAVIHASVGRADGYVGYFRGARGPWERSPWTREPRPWHLRLSGGLGRKESRFRGRKARSGEDLVMAKGPFGKVPRPPEPTPLDSAPSRPHRLLRSPAYLLGGGLSASHARLGHISGLMHGHAQAEEACRR
jgi:hypothetical protein